MQSMAEAEAEVAYGAPGDLPELWREATTSMAQAQKEQAMPVVAWWPNGGLTMGGTSKSSSIYKFNKWDFPWNNL